MTIGILLKNGQIVIEDGAIVLADSETVETCSCCGPPFCEYGCCDDDNKWVCPEDSDFAFQRVADVYLEVAVDPVFTVLSTGAPPASPTHYYLELDMSVFDGVYPFVPSSMEGEDWEQEDCRFHNRILQFDTVSVDVPYTKEWSLGGPIQYRSGNAIGKLALLYYPNIATPTAPYLEYYLGISVALPYDGTALYANEEAFTFSKHLSSDYGSNHWVGCGGSIVGRGGVGQLIKIPGDFCNNTPSYTVYGANWLGCAYNIGSYPFLRAVDISPFESNATIDLILR